MTKTTRQRRSAEEYQALLAEHASSGMTLKAFAKSKNIKPMTFYAWSRRFRARTTSKVGEHSPQVVPVDVLDAPRSHWMSARAATCAPGFAITVAGDRVIGVPAGFDAAELRRLLDVLEDAC